MRGGKDQGLKEGKEGRFDGGGKIERGKEEGREGRLGKEGNTTQPRLVFHQ